MTATLQSSSTGLDGVIALDSAVCRLSADGLLSYRGYDVRDLAEQSTYEETAFLLTAGRLPDEDELLEFRAALHRNLYLSNAARRSLRMMPADADPMSVLRVAVSAAAEEDRIKVPPQAEEALRQGIRLIGLAPAVVAAIHRLRSGARPLAPGKDRGLAASFLYLLHGKAPEPEVARAFDAALILRADNELNPSTFTARVTAATGTDVYGAVSAALAALAGPRHGWHGMSVMRMLEEIGDSERVPGYVREKLGTFGKIPGFGHQVYRGEDPRSGQLRALVNLVAKRTGAGDLAALAQTVEDVVFRETGQYPIVDFYLAPLFRALGIPTVLFTAVFAVSRMSGWVAHILEQYGDERLIRPRARYVGALEQRYTGMDQRRR